MTKSGINSGNVLLFIKSTWTGTTPITVTATMKDLVPAPTPPDSGSAKDPDHTITWTLVKQKACPQRLTFVAGGPKNTWIRNPARYTYRGDPDIPPAGRPDYKNDTFLESFGTITALGFAMSDLTTAFKTANPTLTTPDLVAAFIWNSGNNSTFVFLNNQDTVTDTHGGFGITSPFKPTAFQDADGVGYVLPQTYICGGTTIGNAVIRRRITTANGSQVKKTGP